jgi:Helix-turn-helix domain
MKEKVETISRKIKPKPLNTTFAPIPNWLLSRPEISFGAKALYGRLIQFADQDGVAWPNQQTLAQELGIKDRQLRTYLQELVSFLLIGIELQGMPASNRYYFFYHPWMEAFSQQNSAQPNLDQPKDRQPSAEQDRQPSAEQDRQSSAEQDRQSSAEQDRQSSAEQDRQPSTYNKNKEKNKEKNTHAEAKESVCVLSYELSAYSEEQWLEYALAQRGVHSPEALANSLARSKRNDHLMKKFLETLEKEKQKAAKHALEAQQQSLDLEREKRILVQRLLALNEPLLDWQIQFVQDNEHLLPNKLVS